MLSVRHRLRPSRHVFPPLPPHFCVKTHASTHAFKSRCRSVTVMSRIYGSIYLRQSPVNMTTFWFLSADISARGCFFILVESTIRRKGETKAVLLGNSLGHMRRSWLHICSRVPSHSRMHLSVLRVPISHSPSG